MFRRKASEQLKMQESGEFHFHWYTLILQAMAHF